MRLALASYASTDHASTPHCDLDLLYHDGRANRLDKRLWHFREREPEDRGRCAAGRLGAHGPGRAWHQQVAVPSV